MVSPRPTLYVLDSLRILETDYAFMMATGSLQHAPTDVMKPEELLRHLKLGGRWV
jgi:hypothetical protein